MDTVEIPYLLKRARAHRRLGQVATCREARSIHRQFVRNYQNRLVAIRHGRLSSPIPLTALETQRLGLFGKMATMAADGKTN
jgi:uncharacterized protein YqjF (DUF2071 family)